MSHYYFNSVRNGFTGFCFTVHIIVSVTLQPSAPQPLATSTGALRKGLDRKIREVVQLFTGAVTVSQDRGHNGSCLLLIGSTEERSDGQEEEKRQITLSELS